MRRAAYVALTSATFALASLVGTANAETASSVTFSLPQAQLAAREALAARNYKLALQLGSALLQADPNNGAAHYIVAMAQAGLGNAREGRHAARKAFNKAQSGDDRFIAAQVAAKLALNEKRYTLAQYWLRRSVDSAPSTKLRDQTANDFRRVQSLKKVNWRASFSIQPSDNVNSGTDETHLIIDGLAVVGSLDGASRALSGVVTKAEVHTSYRLSQSSTALWQLTGRAYIREVALSSAAKAMAPSLTSSDLSSATYEVGVARFGKAGKGKFAGTSQVKFNLGRNTSGRDPLSDYAKLSVRRSFSLGQSSKLSLGATYKKIFYKNAARNQTDDYQLRADYFHSFASSAQLSTGFVLGQIDSERGNSSNASLTGYVSYDFAQKFGPAKLSATLGARMTDYDIYRIGLWPAPGGRQDKNVFGTLKMRFEDIEVAGFIPTASLEYYKTTSNISRFQADGASLSIGFASNF